MGRLILLLGVAVAITVLVRPPAAREGPRLPRRVTRVVRLHPFEPGDAGFLNDLVLSSDVILVGTAVAVVREDLSPVNATDPGCWHGTTYLVDVERYLSWEGAPDQPPTIKVAVDGGADRNGVLRVYEGHPRLNVGSRYLLFLNSGRHAKGGPNGEAISVCGEAEGVALYADEYLVATPLRAIVQIENGITTLPQDPYQPDLQPWVFYDGTTLLGMPEQQAIAWVEQVIAEEAAYRRELEQSMN